MKKLFLAILLVTGVTAFGQTKGPVIAWEKSTFDFGDVPQGDKVEHTFKFKNTGNEPLIITNVQVTCGCTTPKGWARDPIAPGQSGEITIAFNSLGKFGKQNKVVTVVSNAANAEGGQISFSANVVEKKTNN
jgi:hypothetical protein